VAWAVFGVLSVVAAIIVAIRVAQHAGVTLAEILSTFGGSAILVLISVVAIGIYFAPTIVAAIRRHPNTAPIVVVNILLGWTLVGYVVALAWSLTAIQAQRHLHYHMSDNSFD
jgi:hypothetical protein